MNVVIDRFEARDFRFVVFPIATPILPPRRFDPGVSGSEPETEPPPVTVEAEGVAAAAAGVVVVAVVEVVVLQ